MIYAESAVLQSRFDIMDEPNPTGHVTPWRHHVHYIIPDELRSPKEEQRICMQGKWCQIINTVENQCQIIAMKVLKNMSIIGFYGNIQLI